MYRSLLSLGLVLSLAGTQGLSAAPNLAEPFPLSQVRILDGPFRTAQDLDRKYILALDSDRLLAGFRSEAGLEPKAPKYPNWESSGLTGHTAGHYLSALALMWAATGDAEMKRRLDYTIAEMAGCQRANANGYVGGVPGSKALWTAIGAGEFDAQNFSLKEAWVPWYNVHKTFVGLYDAWIEAKNPQARDVLIGLADWCGAVIGRLSDEKLQAMMRAEHGGMNEALANVHAITGDKKYLELAQRFTHRAILEPLVRHEDKLTGLHTNTQVPKAIGLARIAELGGDPAWRDAAGFFWDTFTGSRIVAFGGASVREHFNPPHDFTSMLETREGPESCVTYNMLKLTEVLFRSAPDARYADYYERALFNHILSLQHPVDGGFVYFTPVRPRHYRVYSQPSQCFWCCVGTGIENPGRFGAFIYAHHQDALWVNLFVASELDWPERGLRLRQQTKFPDETNVSLQLTLKQPQVLALRLRHPRWVGREEFSVKINGKAWPVKSTPASYVEIKREWQSGDHIEVSLPMHTTIEPISPGSEYVAVLHGPVVLAAATEPAPKDGLIAGDARMGHVAPGAFLPLDEAPMLVGERAALASAIKPVPGKSLTFTARELIRPEKSRELQLEPFFRLHDARYMIYWRNTTPEKYEQVVADLARSERERLALEERTVDQVLPGQQQPEVEHNFRSEQSKSGFTVDRPWRDAAGWFSYDLKAVTNVPLVLQVTTYDMEERDVSIEINGVPLGAIRERGWRSERFIEHVYPIPAELVAAAPDRVLVVRFSAARPNRRTGGIYGVRLFRK